MSTSSSVNALFCPPVGAETRRRFLRGEDARGRRMPFGRTPDPQTFYDTEPRWPWPEVAIEARAEVAETRLVQLEF